MVISPSASDHYGIRKSLGVSLPLVTNIHHLASQTQPAALIPCSGDWYSCMFVHFVCFI